MPIKINIIISNSNSKMSSSPSSLPYLLARVDIGNPKCVVELFRLLGTTRFERIYFYALKDDNDDVHRNQIKRVLGNLKDYFGCQVHFESQFVFAVEDQNLVEWLKIHGGGGRHQTYFFDFENNKKKSKEMAAIDVLFDDYFYCKDPCNFSNPQRDVFVNTDLASKLDMLDAMLENMQQEQNNDNNARVAIIQYFAERIEEFQTNY